MTDEEYEEQEERAERISELKKTLSDVINHRSNLGHAYPFEIEGDILYEGPLTPLLEFFDDYRSELEELQ